MMMSLDQFVFDMSTLPFQELKRQASWRHPTNSRIGARSGSQFTGAGEETISITGWIAPELAGSLASIQTLRDMANVGDSYVLVDGTGAVYGSFEITNVNDAGTLHYKDGTPRRMEFELSLNRTDDDQPEPAVVIAPPTANPAAANTPAENTPAASTADSGVTGVADTIANFTTSVQQEFSNVAGPIIENVGAAMTTLGAASTAAMGMIGAVQGQLSSAATAINTVKALKDSVTSVASVLRQVRAGNVRASLSTIGSSLSRLQEMAGTTTRVLANAPADAGRAVSVFNNRVTDLENSAQAARGALEKLNRNG